MLYRIHDAARARLQPPLGGRRPRGLGQPGDAASRPALRREPFEAPLSDYVPINFGKSYKEDGYNFSDIDKKIVTHPKTPIKLKRFMSRSKYNFTFILYNTNHVDKNNVPDQPKAGMTYHNEIKRKYPEVYEVIKNRDLNKEITCIFTSNYGADKEMFTPWIMVHRFAHAISGSGPFGDFFEVMTTIFERILKNLYNDKTLSPFNVGGGSPYSAGLIKSIGTMAAARNGKIYPGRGGEFLIDLIVQYINLGTVKFNPYPDVLYPFYDEDPKIKTPTGGYPSIEELTKSTNLWIDSILKNSVGMIYTV